MCVDYHRLDKVAVLDAFPMLHVAELVELIGNVQYITQLSLAKGYRHIPVAKGDRAKTVFRTPWGLYEFIWIPFRLHRVVVSFQRLMNWILEPHASYAMTYLDDVIIFTWTWAQHPRVLRAILSKILREAGMTVTHRSVCWPRNR